MNQPQTGHTKPISPVIDQTSGIGHQPGASPSIGHDFESKDKIGEKTHPGTGAITAA